MEAFIGTILPVGFNYAPRGWAFCNGQTLPISQYNALFALLGTTYGGDGIQTFGLPNLQGRMPMHFGAGAGLSYRTLGEMSGEENVTLLTAQMPTHSHTVPPTPGGASAGPANSTSPIGNFPAPFQDGTGTDITAYCTTQNGSTGTGTASSNSGLTGGNQPHDNMPPFLCINFIIALEGIFPARN